MHISPGVDLLRRVVSWLAPGGWVLLEEPDFGMWTGDADPVWAAAPQSAQAAFPGLGAWRCPKAGLAPPGSPARPRV